MSVDITGQRTMLGDALRDTLPSTVEVVPVALDGLAKFPAVVLGMPSWKPGPTGCLESYEFPVAVIVARPGISDPGTVTELDELWPQVLEALRSLEEQRPSFTVNRAEFGGFPIQGTTYPAQVLFCSFTG